MCQVFRLAGQPAEAPDSEDFKEYGARMFPRWVGLAVVLLTVTIRASAIEATLVADAHVNAARPMANSGAISNLNVGGDYTALMQFDLGNLPSGTTAAQVSRAVLRLYCNRADVPGNDQSAGGELCVGRVQRNVCEFAGSGRSFPGVCCEQQPGIRLCRHYVVGPGMDHESNEQ